MSTTLFFKQHFWIIFLLMSSCHTIKRDNPAGKEEILALEHAFMERVAERGLGDAFVHYADENAVLVRNNRLIRGKKEIKEYYNQQQRQDIQLTWIPEFVEMSSCGDFAYTYGTYLYSVKDSASQESEMEGIFHTVWKRQEDGSWKYVYD